MFDDLEETVPPCRSEYQQVGYIDNGLHRNLQIRNSSSDNDLPASERDPGCIWISLP